MDILAAKVNLPPIDKQLAVASIKDIPEDKWFWDTYRHTNMLPLMTMGGLDGREGTSHYRERQVYEWVDYAPAVITKWFDTHVFPWLGMKSRVMCLKTKPHTPNEEHIDCSRHVFGSRQHKFRIVLQGRTDTLYFITKQGNVKLFNTDGPFIMDGSWPHGMINDTDEEKYTLAVGAPWCGRPHYGPEVYEYIHRNVDELPDDYTKYFDNRSKK